MRFLIIGCLFFGVTQKYGVSQVTLDETGLRGAIDVVVVDSFGSSLSDAIIYCERLSLQKTASKVRVQGFTTNLIEYGKYRVTVEVHNHAIAFQEVDLHEPRISLVVGLVPYALDELHNHITFEGRLTSPRRTSCDLVRLSPLFASTPPYNARVYEDRFTISDAKPGRYAAVLFGIGGVCKVSEITIGLGVTHQSSIVQ
jgi:hypothetical protein